MRRSLYSTLSFILILCCCAGLFSFFQMDVAQVVCKIKAHQQKSEQQLTTIKISATSFGSHKAGDEVHIDGVLYDIARVDIANNVATVCLYRDTDEADVINEIVSVFQIEDRYRPADKYTHIYSHKLFVPDGKILLTPYEYAIVAAFEQKRVAIAALNTFTVDITTNIIKPPPQQIC